MFTLASLFRPESLKRPLTVYKPPSTAVEAACSTFFPNFNGAEIKLLLIIAPLLHKPLLMDYNVNWCFHCGVSQACGLLSFLTGSTTTSAQSCAARAIFGVNSSCGWHSGWSVSQKVNHNILPSPASPSFNAWDCF